MIYLKLYKSNKRKRRKVFNGKIAVLGYGVVGSGTVEVIEKNKEGLLKKAGQEIEIKYILDLRDFPTVLIKTSL